ncbi:MAG: hypothetical protein DWQ07_12660 [Chloroflexi bacterium]|nr:MAG: hypothetical protein DWQ07_12660 [Chloroflexota bacterium]MBL1196890.1 hypothetical protein [Chloroflexota bacterium]NOH14186.1 hypothetical protein [Chloroflexota bacterium]
MDLYISSVSDLYDPRKYIPEPQSSFWRKLADGECQALRDKVGEEDYLEWLSTVWPDSEMIQRFTWRTIYEMTSAAYHAANYDQPDIERMARAARHRLLSTIQQTPIPVERIQEDFYGC